MREQIEQRLADLRNEHETGARMLADLEVREAELRQTLLRIDGAVQVLSELLGDGPADGSADGSADSGAPAPVATAAAG